MIYLSKGILLPDSSKDRMIVVRCGKYFELTGAAAKLWIDGQYRTKILLPKQEKVFKELLEKGLVEAVDEAVEKAGYRILTNCVICPKPKRNMFSGLNEREKLLLTWISSSGIRLTVAELVYLIEQSIKPSVDLLGKSGVQRLIWTLYANQPAVDCILETLMEDSPACNETISGVLSLLRKKKLIII